MLTRLFLFVTGKAADLRQREDGASAVEYGMLVALIAAVVVATVALLGPKIRDAFQAIVDALTGAGV
jgi:pilus assembly protein Flp/PilA